MHAVGWNRHCRTTCKYKHSILYRGFNTSFAYSDTRARVHMRELILLSILALTSCASASYVRYQRDAANVLSTAPTSASKLAVKIVLEEQNEHAKIENHYIKQMDSLTDLTVDVRKKDLRNVIVKKAEAKEVLSVRCSTSKLCRKE